MMKRILNTKYEYNININNFFIDFRQVFHTMNRNKLFLTSKLLPINYSHWCELFDAKTKVVT